MELGYTILNPEHRKYKTGTIVFQHGKDGFYGLKSIDFIVDNQKFSMNMLLTKNYSLINTWIFHKQGSFKAVSAQELEMLLALTDDVLENFNFSKSLINILAKIRPQSALYFKLLDKNLSTEEKKALKQEFRKSNILIQNHNTAYSAYAKRKLERCAEIEAKNF